MPRDNQRYRERERELPALEGLSLPYSLEAEQSVLGAVLLDPEALVTALDFLKPQHFYLSQHREIFAAMVRMFSASASIDVVTLLDDLKQNGVYDDAGGKAYLLQLAQMVPSVKNVAAYARIVLDKYYLRSLINASREIIGSATEESDDAATILDAAEQKIFDIRQDKAAEGLRPIKEVILETFERLHQITGEEKDKNKAVMTGFADLDRLMTGLNKTDLIVLAARPAMGKTSFALNIAHNVALRGHKVAVFSLEMSAEQLASRVLSDESNINSRSLRTGELTPDDWVKFAQAADTLSHCELYIDDTPGITTAEMKARCRREKNLELVIIDYLQLMSAGQRVENRVQEISQITRNLKIMAKDLNVPVIVLSQLSRSVEQRSEHRPQLSDLRESGSIEQDADIVLFLSREGNGQSEENLNQVTCIVAKNRHGSTDDVPLYWDGEHTRFSSMERYRNEP